MKKTTRKIEQDQLIIHISVKEMVHNFFKNIEQAIYGDVNKHCIIEQMDHLENIIEMYRGDNYGNNDYTKGVILSWFNTQFFKWFFDSVTASEINEAKLFNVVIIINSENQIVVDSEELNRV